MTAKEALQQMGLIETFKTKKQVSAEKLERFADLLEKDQLQDLIKRNVDCEVNRVGCKTSIITGSKYTKVNVGSSGKYMVVNETEEIYGIKGYGVIHKGHCYGTLDTVNNYYWGCHRAYKKGN